MITFNFYRIKEKKPKDGEFVVWIKTIDDGFSVGTTFLEDKVSYEYCEVDETGTYTGASFSEPRENTVEVVIFGGKEVNENTYWCYSDDWWNTLKADGVKI